MNRVASRWLPFKRHERWIVGRSSFLLLQFLCLIEHDQYSDPVLLLAAYLTFCYIAMPYVSQQR